MSLNRSVPQLPKPLSKTALPDYAELLRFLVQPFLETSNSLSVDCEVFPNTARIWIRVAFEGEDKGRVFGRGGRNIQSIRTVIEAAAAAAGYSVYLDIYDSQAFASASNAENTENRLEQAKSQAPRVITSKPAIKLRSQSSPE